MKNQTHNPGGWGKQKTRLPILFLLVLGLLVSACTAGGLEPQPAATSTPSQPAVTPTLPVSEVPEDILRLAYDDLAARLSISWLEISLVNGEQVDFPDSCLGIARPEMACMQVITPGYRIQLQAGGQVYTYVTNLEGSQVMLDEKASPAVKTTPVHDRVVLSWGRSGGIAGFCDEINIHASGLVVVNSCKAAVRSFQLSTAEQALLNGWLAKFAPLEYNHSDPNAVADGMSTALTLAGAGKNKPTEDQLNELLQFAAQLAAQP